MNSTVDKNQDYQLTVDQIKFLPHRCINTPVFIYSHPRSVRLPVYKHAWQTQCLSEVERKEITVPAVGPTVT